MAETQVALLVVSHSKDSSVFSQNKRVLAATRNCNCSVLELTREWGQAVDGLLVGHTQLTELVISAHQHAPIEIDRWLGSGKTHHPPTVGSLDSISPSAMIQFLQARTGLGGFRTRWLH